MERLPKDIENLILDYREYVERNDQILRELSDLYFEGYEDRVYDDDKRKIRNHLNKMMKDNGFNSRFTIDNNTIHLATDYNDITDDGIEKFILYFLTQDDEDNDPPLIGQWFDHVAYTNNILKSHHSRLRVIIYCAGDSYAVSVERF